jgi:hypothetical protein
MGVNGWAMDRLWLYLVGSALLMLVGLQLSISWVLMRTLEELSERELHTQADMQGGGTPPTLVGIRVNGKRS